MKKFLLLFAVAIITSCSSDDNQTQSLSSDSSILGKWKNERLFNNNTEYDFDFCEIQTNWNFSENNALTIEEFFQNSNICSSNTNTIQYSVSEGVLTITNPTGGHSGGVYTTKSHIKELTLERLILEEFYEVDQFGEEGEIPVSERWTTQYIKVN